MLKQAAYSILVFTLSSALPTAVAYAAEEVSAKAAPAAPVVGAASDTKVNTTDESAKPAAAANSNATKTTTIAEICERELLPFVAKKNAKGEGGSDDNILKAACATVQVMPGCQSVQGQPIYHYDRKGVHKSQQKILVFSLIHGDETPAGTVGRFWMERLQSIEPRNSWRVVPVLNPDGVKLKTRTNANKVDVNRNFPTEDWSDQAKKYWLKEKQNPRRFPGAQAASEPETKCAIQHIQDFQPDFVVSIHTPLKVLDFDGPKVKAPKFDYLPWKSLGSYPGSLGRYLWVERKTPVLTAEFKEDFPPEKPVTQLQDIVGFLVSLEIKGKEEARQVREAKKEIKTVIQN